MKTIPCLFLCAAACATHADPAPGEPRFPPPGAVAGPRGDAWFAGFMLGTGARPIAAGGAFTFAQAGLRDATRSIASLESSDPAVFEARSRTALPGRDVMVSLTSHRQGTADLVLRDASGAELDRTTITVTDTNLLEVLRGWTGAAPTVLADTPVAIHVNTVLRDAAGEHISLVGSGAVQFTGAGVITTDPPRAGEPGADLATLRGAVGDGVVTASCPSARLDVPIHVVATSALTAIAAPDAIVVTRPNAHFDVGAIAGTTPVYGVACSWEAPAGVTIAPPYRICAAAPCTARDPITSLADPAPLTYTIDGPAGTHTLTCTIPGGLKKTIAVMLR